MGAYAVTSWQGLASASSAFTANQRGSTLSERRQRRGYPGRRLDRSELDRKGAVGGGLRAALQSRRAILRWCFVAATAPHKILKLPGERRHVRLCENPLEPWIISPSRGSASSPPRSPARPETCNGNWAKRLGSRFCRMILFRVRLDRRSHVQSLRAHVSGRGGRCCRAARHGQAQASRLVSYNLEQSRRHDGGRRSPRRRMRRADAFDLANRNPEAHPAIPESHHGTLEGSERGLLTSRSSASTRTACTACHLSGPSVPHPEPKAFANETVSLGPIVEDLCFQAQRHGDLTSTPRQRTAGPTGRGPAQSRVLILGLYPAVTSYSSASARATH